MLGSVSALLLFEMFNDNWVCLAYEFLWHQKCKYAYLKVLQKNLMILFKKDTVRRKLLMSAKTGGVNSL